MKQMDECLTRALAGKEPLPSKKWKAFMVWTTDKKNYAMYLYHYHHLVMVYTSDHKIQYEWWEKPTDKRGLEAAKAWLENYYNRRLT